MKAFDAIILFLSMLMIYSFNWLENKKENCRIAIIISVRIESTIKIAFYHIVLLTRFILIMITMLG